MIVSAVFLGVLCLSVWLALRFDPFGRARAHYENRRYLAALGAAEDHLKRWPGDLRASLMAARCATRIGQPTRAENHYVHAGTLEIADLQDRAYGMVQMQQPARALELYGELLEREPMDPLALKRLAAVLMGLKRYKKLPEITDRLISIPGQEVPGYTLAGIAHHVDGEYPESVRNFLRVLELDPDLKLMPLPSSLFWNHLASDLLAQGQYTEARNYLMRALAESQDAGLTELLGTTYQQEGRPDEAERYWRLAIERDPQLSHAWLDLGQLAITRRKPEEAVALLTKAAELAPDMVEPFQNLSVAYKLLGKTEPSERYRKIASDLRAKKAASSGSASTQTDPNAVPTGERR